MKFSFKDALRARVMRRRRLCEQDILTSFAGKYSSADLDWLIGQIRLRSANYRAANYNGARPEVTLIKPISIPVEVLQHQGLRAMLRPLTTTALLCGDPLPGESALDRRPVQFA